MAETITFCKIIWVDLLPSPFFKDDRKKASNAFVSAVKNKMSAAKRRQHQHRAYNRRWLFIA